MSKYKELKEPCKSALKYGYCLGCQGLENENFIEPRKCNNLRKLEQMEIKDIVIKINNKN